MKLSIFIVLNIFFIKGHCFDENNFGYFDDLSVKKSLVHHRFIRDIDCIGNGRFVPKLLSMYFNRNRNHTGDEQKIQFIFSTRLKHESKKFMIDDQLNLDEIDFKIERRTFVIVHGFLADSNKLWIHEMKEALLLWGDVNVIIVNWGEIAKIKNYYYAASHTRIVAHTIVEFFSEIINITTSLTESPKWGPIHLIGHSLGAHICFMTANSFKQLSSMWNITRVTGLDPARPCFKRTEIYENTAPFIDIIHTNGVKKRGLGLPNAIGHMDFYPNGGAEQLGCSKMSKRWKAAGMFGLPAKTVKKSLCSHTRAHILFTESIIEAHYKNGSFLGKPWNTTIDHALEIINQTCEVNECPEMGINAENYSQRGIFFVVTSQSSPYSDVKTSDILALKNLLKGKSNASSNVRHYHSLILVITMYNLIRINF